MHCRSSLLELISQCNSPAMEVSACSANLSSAMAASAALLQVHQSLVSTLSVQSHCEVTNKFHAIVSRLQRHSKRIVVAVSYSILNLYFIKELDIENLQLLSDELLAPPQPHGCVGASSLLSSPSAWLSMASNTCAASDVFYHQPDTLREELRVAIARAATQGEDYLIELSNQICICLQVSQSHVA